MAVLFTSKRANETDEHLSSDVFVSFTGPVTSFRCLCVVERSMTHAKPSGVIGRKGIRQLWCFNKITEVPPCDTCSCY